MVLGEHRAIPTNYQHVVINDAASIGSMAATIMQTSWSQAADEADNGYAFTTDFVGPHEDVGYPPLIDATLIEALDEVRDLPGGLEVLEELLNAREPLFTPDADVLRLMRGVLTVTDDQTIDEVLGCLRCNRDNVDIAVDGPALAEALSTLNDGRAEIKRLFDSLPYLSRLYGTMSPAEMTMDPVFAFNRDLEPVSNIRTATLEIICEDSGRTVEQILVTEGGLRVPLPQGDNPDLIQRQNGETVRGMDTMGAALITQEMEAGMGEVVADNSAMIQAKYNGGEAPVGGKAAVDTDNPDIGAAGSSSAIGGTTAPELGGADGEVTITGSAARSANSGSVGCACDSWSNDAPSIPFALCVIGVFIARTRRSTGQTGLNK